MEIWELPVIALRNTVVFPRTLVNVDVGRAKSKRALEDAQAADNKILLLAQNDPRTDDPSEGDLYRVGTLAVVKQVIRLPDNTLQVLVEGKDRARVISFLSTGYLRARAIALAEEPGAKDALEALGAEAKRTFDKYIAQNKAMPRLDAFHLEALKSLRDGSQVADLVSHYSTFEVKDKQDVLELLDPEARLERVLVLLNRELEKFETERRIAARVKDQIDQNQKEYYLREQMKAIQSELGGGEDTATEAAELRERVEKAGMPAEVKEKAQREVKRLEKMHGSSPEATVVRTYLDWLLAVPWSAEDEEKLDIKATRTILDEDHYGLEDVKERIIEFLAVRQLNKMVHGEQRAPAVHPGTGDPPQQPAAGNLPAGEPGAALAGARLDDASTQTGAGAYKSPILCLVGPPGVGKTSLGRSIARSLNRTFVRMSLGGVRDEAEIRGHRRTYIGALPGRIVQGMRQAGKKNPVFLLDEIDKLSSDFRGDPASALLEVLDPEQNHTFQDHYLEVAYDLSKVMFVTTANTTQSIPRPLLDRMEVIRIPGYTLPEKIQIAVRFRWGRQIKEHALEGKIDITEAAIETIIREYTSEAGVRNLDRNLAKICRKAAKEFIEEPWEGARTVDSSDVRHYLGVPQFLRDKAETTAQVGVAQGLAYTPVGGQILVFEALVLPGSGKVNMTGQLGEVMKESAQAAIAYLRARAPQLATLADDFHQKFDFHIHVAEGAMPKEGPSAGITMATAMISAILKRPVKPGYAMTGEITLRGNVLPIGGVKEKLLAAHQAGIREVLLPKDNQANVEEVPEAIRGDLNLHFVQHMDEVLELVLEGGLAPGPAPASA